MIATSIPLADIEADLRRRGIDPEALKYSEDQPRVPAGDPEGGQWVGPEGGDSGDAQSRTAALSAYMTNYVETNTGLRESGTVNETVKHLDAAIANSSPLESDAVFYRGLSLDMEEPAAKEFMGKLKKGYDFSDRGFVSVTADKDIALRFATEGNTGDTQLLFTIAVEAGSRMATVPSGLAEKLLPRGTGHQRFKVDKIRKGKDVIQVEARWLP